MKFTLLHPNKLAEQPSQYYFWLLSFPNIKVNWAMAVQKIFRHQMGLLPGKRGGLGFICAQRVGFCTPGECVELCP